MTRGLIIGKFMPVHMGHIALIKFAAAQCDQVIVSMSHKPDDSINASMRFDWLTEVVQDISNVQAFMIADDFDDESLPLEQRTTQWAPILKAKYGGFDCVFSSEAYGPYLAAHMQAKHIAFDPPRTQFPVSAYQIRKEPFAFWEFIPAAVRPWFVKKVCFFGPESTGKSFLAEKMAQVYQTEFVPEVAREIITSNHFTVDDIIRIGKEQTARIKLKARSANKILFCDTDLITTQVYSRHYLGVVPEILQQLEMELKYDRHFLFDIDVPWIADGLRDLGKRRQEMYDVFRSELVKRGISYIPVNGTYEQREAIIMKEVDRLIGQE